MELIAMIIIVLRCFAIALCSIAGVMWGYLALRDESISRYLISALMWLLAIANAYVLITGGV